MQVALETLDAIPFGKYLEQRGVLLKTILSLVAANRT